MTVAPRSATELLLLVLCPLLDRVSRVGEVVIELRQRGARILSLVRASERHAELQQIVWCLGPLRIALVTLGKRTGRVGESFPLVIALAEPILGIPSECIVRVLLNKASQCCFSRRIIRLLYPTERKVILVKRRARRQSSIG